MKICAFLFSILLLATHADELPRGHFTLTDVEVVPIERSRTPDGKTNDHKSDVLTHWIRFDVKTTFKPVVGTEKKPMMVTNEIDAKKSSVTVDKAVKHNGKEVKAGTNLMTLKKFNGRMFNISMPRLHPFAMGSVTIREGFEFPPDDYKLTFAWQTKSGQTFSEEVKVRIDLKKP